MFGEVKNPFGLRNGVHITVNDLSETERGLACNCVCPLCKEPFEARLGNVRIHHFAHSGEGCNEVAAYLMGLYGFFVDFIRSHNCVIPELVVYYSVDEKEYIPITADNYLNQLWLRPRTGYNIKRRALSGNHSIRFDDAEIVLGKNQRPEAVIATYKGKRIAFVISPPDTVCKDFTAKPYKDLATLEIMLSQKADLISRANTEMMNAIFSDPKNYEWLSSPLLNSVFAQVNEEREEAFRLHQVEIERIRLQHEEARKRQEELWKRQQEQLRIESEKKRLEEEEKEKLRREREARQEETDRILVAEKIKIPGELVVDSHGRRWIQCEICGKIATEDEFWTYQYNRGKCKSCGRIKSEAETNTLIPHGEKPMRHINICPWCGGQLIKRTGKNGEFIGCSNFPNCRYSKSV